MIVDFPAPVAPTIPTRSPGLTSNDTSRSTQVVARVGERDVLEHDVPLRRRAGVRQRLRRADDRRRGVEQLEDPLRRGHGGLEDVELLREVADRAVEALRVQHERDERPDRQRAVQDPVAAEPDDERGGEGADDFDRGVEHRVVVDRLHVRVAVPVVDRVEVAVAALLAAEQLHRRHAGDVLLEKRVDARDPGPHLAVRLADVACGTTASRRRSAAAPRRRSAASRQSIQASAPMIPTSTNTSPNTETTPAVNSSLSTSTSVVTRVISRPTGLRS